MVEEENTWKKSFERERKARKEAELLLENKSAEVFNINKIKVKDAF